MHEVLYSTPFTLECLSPIHVGSGEKLGGLDFVREGGHVVVLDQRKMAAVIEARHLEDAYVRLCESGRPDVQEFLRTSRVPPREVAAYILRITGSVGREILPFIKTPDGRVYMPGSSVKGAIRSALLHRIVEERADVRQAIATEAIRNLGRLRRPAVGRMSAKLRGASDLADQSAFGKDHNRNVMRILHLVDTRSIPPGQLSAAEVRVLTVRDGKLEVKETQSRMPMRLTAEILPAGTRLGAEFTRNAYLEDSQGPARALGLGDRVEFVAAWVAHCNAMAQAALQREADFARRFGHTALAGRYEAMLQQVAGLGAQQCILHLGWGAGYDAMALGNLFDPESRRRIRIGANLGKIDRGEPVEPFPKSRKVVWGGDGSSIDPLGWILLTLGERLGKVEVQEQVLSAQVQPAAQLQPAEEAQRPAQRSAPEGRQAWGRDRELKPRDVAKIEALRRSLEKDSSPDAKKKTTSKASEKAKREQEQINKKFRGEE